MTFEDLQKANETLSTMDIKGKNYVLVNERVKAFRMLYPEGTITTEILSIEDGVVMMRANVLDASGKLLSSGLAYEKETSSYINKTSYIENCETSAVGRALGFLGIGVDTSIASYEEVENAINNQQKITKAEAEDLEKDLNKADVNIEKLLKQYKVKKIGDLTPGQMMHIYGKLDDARNKGTANSTDGTSKS